MGFKELTMKLLQTFGMVNPLNVCSTNQHSIHLPEIYEKQTLPELSGVNPMLKPLPTNKHGNSKDTLRLERFSLYKSLTDCKYITSKGWVNNQLAKELSSPQDILTKFCKKPDSMPDKLSKTKILKYLIKKRASLFFKSREGTLYNILKRSNNNLFLQKALKAHLHCWKEKHMREYLLLRKISKRIKIEDNQLTVKNTFLACTRVRSLPEGLHFKENLNLQFCYKLTVIQNLHVGECLDLKGCFNLDSIFKHLFVGLDLNLTHCHHLNYLSENIFVGRNLNLEYCTEIKQLPENMFVGGTLNLEMCENIRLTPVGIILF